MLSLGLQMLGADGVGHVFPWRITCREVTITYLVDSCKCVCV